MGKAFESLMDVNLLVFYCEMELSLPAKCLACVLRLPSEGSSSASYNSAVCDAALKN